MSRFEIGSWAENVLFNLLCVLVWFAFSANENHSRSTFAIFLPNTESTSFIIIKQTTNVAKKKSKTMTSIHPRVPKRSTIPTLAAVIFMLLSVSTIVGNAAPAPYELTSKQLSDFRRDGVLVVRGMLSGETLQKAIAAAHTIQRKQSWGQRLVYKLFPSYRNLEFQTYRKQAAFKTVAFDSTAPTICAKLMGLDDEDDGQQGDTTTSSEPRSLRLLKEAVLGFRRGDTGCGWHVDDKTFWPSEDSHEDNNTLVAGTNHTHQRRKHPRRREAGINVWIHPIPGNGKRRGRTRGRPRIAQPHGKRPRRKNSPKIPTGHCLPGSTNTVYFGHDRAILSRLHGTQQARV